MALPTLSKKTDQKTSQQLSQKPLEPGQEILERIKFSEEGRKLKAWVKSEYEKCKSQRLQVQKQWEYNLIMYGGNQWANLLFTGNIANPTQTLKHRVRSITNLIRPIVRTEIARMTNQKPSASVVPVSGSDDDMFAAHGGEAVWESLYYRKNMHQLDIRNAFWTCLTGNGFRKTYWDSTIVDKTFLTADPMLAKPVPSQGDIAFGVVTPFNLFVPDMLVEDIEGQPYVIEAYTKPVVWVNTFWGHLLSKPAVANVIGRFEVFESSYFNAGSGSNEARPDSVLVIEGYFKPGAHPMLPRGGMITVVGDEIVQITFDWPYSHGEYPHAHSRHIPTGKFYGESVLTDIIPLQKEYNRTRSQIIESKQRTARNQLMYQEGSINTRRITSEPGAMIPYKLGFNPPTPLPGQPIPQFVLEELQTIKRDIEDISGQHQVTRGSAPGSGITAATAISYLQEQDDSLMYTTYASIEASYEKIARQALSIVADFWELPKIIRTIGLSGAFDSIELKGADIANGLDIRVEAGSSLPTSKSARQAFLMDLMKMGVITGPQMLDLVDIGGVKKLTELIKVDMDAAQRENLRMKKLDVMEIQMADMQHQIGMENGDPSTFDENTGMTLERSPMVPVNEWDNHIIHIEVHNRFRKSQEFEMLDELIKTEFATHVRYHTIQLMIAQGSQMQAGQAGQLNLQDPGSIGQEPPPPQSPLEGGMPNGDQSAIQ